MKAIEIALQTLYLNDILERSLTPSWKMLRVKVMEKSVRSLKEIVGAIIGKIKKRKKNLLSSGTT